MRCSVAVLCSIVAVVSLSLPSSGSLCSSNELMCGAQCYDPDQKLCCGGLLFDKSEQTCCGARLIGHGKNVDGDDGQGELVTTTERCCGGNSVYDVTTELCCAGVVRSRDTVRGNGRETVCCGNSTYNPATQECCEYDLDPSTHFDVRTREPGHHYRCCGPRVIDIESEDCQGFQIPGLQFVDETRLTCGPLETLYNPQHHICCNDILHRLDGDRPERLQCCGSLIYDTSRSICCNHGNGLIVNVTTGNELCCQYAPLGFIDSTTHICCGEKPHLLLRDDSDVESLTCCGDALIDVTIKGCCYDVAMTTATPYSQLLQKCCGGHVIATEAECCANRWPLPSDAICCPMSGPIRPRRHGDDSCCEPRFTTSERLSYNMHTQVCHNGRVADRWAVATCAGRSYDTATQTCCSGRIFNDMPQLNYRCVNGHPVALISAVNCRLPDHQCGSTCYSADTQICCTDYNGQYESILYSRISDTSACCGANLYDTRHQNCLHGRLIVDKLPSSRHQRRRQAKTRLRH